MRRDTSEVGLLVEVGGVGEGIGSGGGVELDGRGIKSNAPWIIAG